MVTNPIKRALELRQTLISHDKKYILAVDFKDTLQGKDTSRVLDTIAVQGTEIYPFRAKINVKDIDPAAAQEYGKNYFDISKSTDEEIESHLRKQEFDFPLWYKHNSDFKMKDVMDYNAPFIVQVAGCNFHDGCSNGGCWYCFVDDKSNDGIPSKGKTYLSIPEIIQGMKDAKEKWGNFYKNLGKEVNLRVLRLSGGEPTTVLDYGLNLWREVAKQRLDCVGQIDSNLSTGSLVDRFEREGIFEKHTLEQFAEFPVKWLAAIKGVDSEDIGNNVQSTATTDMQKHSLKKFMNAGLDIYPQGYNLNPQKLKSYLENMDNFIENFSLRLHIGPLKVYSPVKQRLIAEAQTRGINPEYLITSKANEWNTKYEQCCDVMNDYLMEQYKVGYKELTRSDVRLKLRQILFPNLKFNA